MPFQVLRPTSAAEVAPMLDELGASARLHAGGTDLLVQYRSGILDVGHVIDLGGIPRLRHITERDDGIIRVGATATLRELCRHPAMTGRFPALVAGARLIGSRQIRNRATLVGNVCNASPAADAVPGLYVFDARVNILGPGGQRVVPIDRFALGPRITCLRSGEWVTSIDLPCGDDGSSSAYEKLGRTAGVDIAVVGVACRLDRSGPRFAASSVAPTVVRLPMTEAELREEGRFTERVKAVLRTEIHPIDDVRASAEYRRRVAPVLAERAWERARSST